MPLALSGAMQYHSCSEKTGPGNDYGLAGDVGGK